MWVCLLLVILLMVAVGPLLAADQPKMTPAEVQAKCAEIDTKCAAAVQMIDDLQALKANLLKQVGEGAPQPPTRPSSWAEKVALSGYFQNRYETFSKDAGSSSQDRFFMRRLYLNIIAKTSARSQAVITVASDGSFVKNTTADFANLYSDYKLGRQDTLRFGQGPTWFGIEGWQSSSQRLPFERSAFVEGGNSGRPSGFFAASSWDRGLWWIHTPQDTSSWCPQTIVSVVNGSFRNDPVINNKTVAVDLKWKPSWGMYGVSWLNGAFDQTPDPTTGKGAFVPGWMPSTQFARDAWLGYVRYEKPKSFALQTEYAGGTLNQDSVRGFYGQGELPLHNTPGTVFVRYDWFSSMQQLAEPARSNGIYQAWALGYAHQLDNNSKLTAQRTWGEFGPKTLNETGVQWQYSF
jgi:hypothetical protein